MRRQLEASIANRGRRPGQVFGERLVAGQHLDHYTAKPLTSKDIAVTRPGRMCRSIAPASQRRRFFLLHGRRLRSRQSAPAAAQDVGRCRRPAENLEFKEVGLCFPKTIEQLIGGEGAGAAGQTVISFFADPGLTRANKESVAAATTCCETALRDNLPRRAGADLDGLGRPGAAAPAARRWPDASQLRRRTENIRAMTDRVMRAIERLQQDGRLAI